MSDQKQTSFKNRPKLTAKKQGKGMGTVLGPTLQHIGNIQKLDHSECSILKLFMTGKGKNTPVFGNWFVLFFNSIHILGKRTLNLCL